MCAHTDKIASKCYDKNMKQLNRSGVIRATRLSADPVRAHRLKGLIDKAVAMAQGRSISIFDGFRNCTDGGAARGGPEQSFARQLGMYLAHVGCRLTYTEAARLYGRDRTTAAHACAVVEARRDDPMLDRTLELLERAVWLGFCQIEPAHAARRRGALGRRSAGQPT
jgi:hypothetical protein